MTADIIAKTFKDSGKYARPEIIQLMADYQDAKRYHQRNIDNCIENWRYYYAKNPELGHGQYKLETVKKLQAQNRAIVQYNICKPTVDALAGSLLQMKFDPAFIPVDSRITSLTEAFQKAMYSDKEMMDWPSAFLALTVGGLIHQGCLKFVIDDRYSKLGNIGLEICPPGTVMEDPWWKTDISKDCKRVFQDVYLTVDEIIGKFPHVADKIKYCAMRERALGTSFGTNSGVTPYIGDENSNGSKYKLIQDYRVVEKTVKTAFIMDVDGDIEIPSKIPTKDIPQWLDANFQDENGRPAWSPDYIYEDTKKIKECRVRTACLALITDDFIEDGLSEVQIEATPFKFWSASRFNGEPHSIIDSVKDPQTNINYMESMLMHKIQTEGTGGPMFGDPSLFADEAEYQRAVANRTNPASVFRLKAGLLERGIRPFLPMITSAPSVELYQNLDRIFSQILPQVSKVTPASLGRPETSNMSGVLYNQLKEQTSIQAYTLHYSYRNFYNDLFEGWMIQAAQTYSNELIPRTFVLKGGRETITLNEQIILEDGSEAIRNDASKFLEMRHKIIISERPESPSEQAATVGIYTDLLQSLSPIPSAQVTVAYLKNQIVQNLYQLSQDQKEELQEIGELELELAKTNVETQLAQARIAKSDALQKAAAIESQQTMQNTQPLPQGTVAQPIQTQPPMAQPPEQQAPQAQGEING